MNRDNQAVPTENNATAPRRTFLRNSMLLAVPLVMGGTAFSAAAAVFVPALRTRGNAVVSVRDHGATGNGSTDDTAAFARAIAALPDTGGTVVVPEGDYLLDPTKRTALRSRMHLQMSSGTRLLAKPNAEDWAYVLDVKNVSDVEISGGQIIGERHQHRGTTGQWGHAIMVEGSKRVTVRDIRLSDCWGDGIQITSARGISSNDVVVANIVSTGNRRQGMSIGGAKNVKVYDSEFSNTHGIEPGCGIDIEPDFHHTDDVAEDIHIENCLIRGNEGNGILVYKRSQGVVIRRCEIVLNNGFGILTSGAYRGYIAANRIGHNRLDGLFISSQSERFTVSGNRFRNNTTRNQGLNDPDAPWSTTTWSAMTGVVAGRNGNQSNISASDDCRSVFIKTNRYKK